MTRRVRTKKNTNHRSRFKIPSEEELRMIRHKLFGLRIVDQEPFSEPIIFIDTEEMINEGYEQYRHLLEGGG